MWRDAVVVESVEVAHRLTTEGDATPSTTTDEYLLHPWNHAPREMPADDFEALRGWWMESPRTEHAQIADALSLGRGLDVLEQCVATRRDGCRPWGPRRTAAMCVAWLRGCITGRREAARRRSSQSRRC